jgi:hypothetical protein
MGGGRVAVLKWVDGHIDLEAEIAPHFAIARPLEFCCLFFSHFQLCIRKITIA